MASIETVRDTTDQLPIVTPNWNYCISRVMWCRHCVSRVSPTNRST